MLKSIQLLTQIADELDKVKLAEVASKVDKIATNLTNIKTAQYVGVQGYWVRNSRCWQNCYRKKRVANQNMPAQKVWSECHKEYLLSLNNEKSEWDRYAENHQVNIKVASAETIKKIAVKQSAVFNDLLNKRLEDGWPIGNAVMSSIQDGMDRYSDIELDQAEVLISVADSLRKKQPKIASKLDDAAMEVIKEAQFWNNLRGMWNQFSNNIGGINNPANFNKQALMSIIGQLENTLNGYRVQKNKLQEMLRGVTGPDQQRAQQISNLMQNLNAKSLQQMKEIASQIGMTPSIDAQRNQAASALADMANANELDNPINGGLPGEQKTPVSPYELNLPPGAEVGGVGPARTTAPAQETGATAPTWQAEKLKVKPKFPVNPRYQPFMKGLGVGAEEKSKMVKVMQRRQK